MLGYVLILLMFGPVAYWFMSLHSTAGDVATVFVGLVCASALLLWHGRKPDETVSAAARAYLDGIDEMMRIRALDGDEEDIMNQLDELWYELSDDDLKVVNKSMRAIYARDSGV